METVTFILEGDIAHFDSCGEKSVIKAGGVQWMTAGKGLIHSEVSSEEFKRDGGPMEILQLWVNLPAKEKMCSPLYKGLQKESMPKIKSEDGLTTVNLVSGVYKGVTAPFDSKIGLHMATIDFKKGANFAVNIPTDENIFFYIIRGNLNVNGQSIPKLSLVEFGNDSEIIQIEAQADSVLLLGHAKPFVITSYSIHYTKLYE